MASWWRARHGSDPDPSLAILRSGGERGEAEAVGAEVAKLLAGGAEPGSIAIALRNPDSRGPLLGRVLSGYGVPVAVEANAPVLATATGGAVIGLLRSALPGGTAADLLAYLRAPGYGVGASVDALERAVRREGIADAAGVADRWRQMGGRGLGHLEAATAAGDDPGATLNLAAEVALDASQWPLKRGGRQGAVLGSEEALEARAGSRIAAGLRDLSELGGIETPAEEIVRLIEAMTIELWSGPATDRVRIASPYRLRATRFRHVFVCSLQDGEFPGHRSGGPFLSADQRLAVGLGERADPEAEERYLFHVCLSLPTDSLFLSYRYCDEEGAPLAPSPYLDEVRELLAPAPVEGEPDPLEASIGRTKRLAAVVFEPSAAPSPGELARSLAARGEIRPGPHLAELGVEEGPAREIAARLEAAAAYQPRPGPLTLSAALEPLARRESFGGTTLEEYATCSYKWFVGHELRPNRLDPDPEPLAQGGAIHSALEALYADRPGGESRPNPRTVDAWIERGDQLLAEELARRGAGLSAAGRISSRRLHSLLSAFLRRDAERADPLRHSQLEASFGMDGDEHGALDLGGWKLRGKIDRIDLDPAGGVAVVHDYKLGKATSQRRFGKDRRLQLPLYLRAVERLWGSEAAAGLYQPLGAAEAAVPRGIARRSLPEPDLDGLGVQANDRVSEEEYEERLREAEEVAGAAVAGMRSGLIDRDPPDGKCPRYCSFAPVCRMDRAAEQDTAAEGGRSE